MTPTLRLAIITIVASFGYIGLAVLGLGGYAAFFSHSPLIALAITGLVLAGVALFSGGNLSAGVRENRASWGTRNTSNSSRDGPAVRKPYSRVIGSSDAALATRPAPSKRTVF